MSLPRWQQQQGMNSRHQVTAGKYGSNIIATFGYDAYGNPLSTVAGTIQNYSYNFDPATGNLNWRQNNKTAGLKETFHYDNLDRLDDVYKGTTMTLDMAYDGTKGGITTKSDVGTLLYGNPGLPYAVSGINPKTTLTPAAAQTITYTSFGSVSTISENNYNATFVYNADNQRAQMIVKQGTTTKLTRWYPTGSYIKETAGSVTKEYTFIGGDAYTAPVAAVKQGSTTTYYDIMRDYLGNITHVVNASTKAVTAQYSFDACIARHSFAKAGGRMRNATTWAYYAPGSEPSLFLAGRGFTGHEHLPWFNVINMNGRVYDPLTGVFLSPDNYIQNPGFTQNYNRYAYCFNNPLKYIDPSGSLSDGLFSWLFRGKGCNTNNDRTDDSHSLGRILHDIFGDIFDGFGDGGGSGSNSGGYTSYSDYSGTVNNLLSEVNSPAGQGDVQKAGMDGGEHLIGPGLILLGQPIKALKPIGALGSKPGSSVASYTLSKAIPQTFTKTLGKEVGTEVATRVGTNVIGRALGRFVPYVGWGLTLYDVYDNRAAIGQFMYDWSHMEWPNGAPNAVKMDDGSIMYVCFWHPNTY